MMEIFLLRCRSFNNFRSVTARRTLKHTQKKKEETTNNEQFTLYEIQTL